MQSAQCVALHGACCVLGDRSCLWHIVGRVVACWWGESSMCVVNPLAWRSRSGVQGEGLQAT